MFIYSLNGEDLSSDKYKSVKEGFPAESEIYRVFCILPDETKI